MNQIIAYKHFELVQKNNSEMDNLHSGTHLVYNYVEEVKIPMQKP